MATKTIQVLTDDLDGSGAADTIHFSYRGAAYVIDLSAKNADAFDEAIEPYLSAARREGRRRTPAARKATTRQATTRQAETPSPNGASSRDLAAIRMWAQKHGHTVAAKGRIASHVVEAFDKAHRRSG